MGMRRNGSMGRKYTLLINQGDPHIQSLNQNDRACRNLRNMRRNMKNPERLTSVIVMIVWYELFVRRIERTR